MKNSTALPDLQIFHTNRLVVHEECDPRRVEKLSQRLRVDGYLKNPPIIAVITDTEKFVVLDGANRTMAYENMDIPHMVAQLVSY